MISEKNEKVPDRRVTIVVAHRLELSTVYRMPQYSATNRKS